MAFAKTFEPAYHFRLLYLPGVLYPIMGALRYCAGESWQVRVTTNSHMWLLSPMPDAASYDARTLLAINELTRQSC